MVRVKSLVSTNSLGYSLNTKNMTELRLAETKLNSLTPNIKAIVGDDEASIWSKVTLQLSDNLLRGS